MLAAVDKVKEAADSGQIRRFTGNDYIRELASGDTAIALEWMNYVYDPKGQADIAEYVNYVTTVEGVRQILRKRDPALASNQLIFPSASYTKNCTFEPVLGGSQGEQVTKAFSQVVGG